MYKVFGINYESLLLKLHTKYSKWTQGVRGRLKIPYSEEKRNSSSVQHKAREGKACKKYISIFRLFRHTLEEGSYLFTIIDLFLRALNFVRVCVCVWRV